MSSRALPFDLAEKACEDDVDNGLGRGHLATIRDGATFNFIVKKVVQPNTADLENTYYWIGGVFILL